METSHGTDFRARPAVDDAVRRCRPGPAILVEHLHRQQLPVEPAVRRWRRWRQQRLLALIALQAALLAGAARAADNPEAALNDPDRVGWRLFVEATAPVAADGRVLPRFLTWANDGDTFAPDPRWPATPTPLTLATPALFLAAEAGDSGVTRRLVPAHGGSLEETRRNRASFDFIVGHGLYKVSGLKAAFGQDLEFPTDAIEVKSNWYPVADPADPGRSGVPGFAGPPGETAARYLVATAGDGRAYALVSLHVISKLVPNWTWATFEHEDNPARCDLLGCRDRFGAAVPAVPPHPAPGQGYGACAPGPALAAMFKAAGTDPVFAHYCLKGTQSDFTDASGLAVRLGNSVTEAPFVDRSSCMTCHGRAGFDADGHASSNGGLDMPARNPPLGPIDPAWFWAASTPPYYPMYQGMRALFRIAQPVDFVWSIPFCALDDTATPPETRSRNCAEK